MPKTTKAVHAAADVVPRAFTVRDLPDLIGERTGSALSVYVPLHTRPDGAGEDRLRWKNLLDEARSKIEAAAYPKTAKRILAPLEALDPSEFAHGERGGLVVFAASDFVRVFRVPMELPERVVVSDSFHVRPLLRFLQSAHRYHVVALSRNAVRVLEGVNGALVERIVPDLPRKLSDVVKEPDGRAGGSVRSAGRTGAIHGGSSEPRSEKEDVARFYRAVDEALRHHLQDEASPVILVGPAKSIAAYRAVARLATIASEHVEGGYDRASADELRELTEPVVRGIVARERAAARDEFHRLVSSFRATDDLRLVGKSVVTGRVRRLLLARGVITPGTLDRASGEIEKKARRASSLGDDLGDDLAEAVLLRGGQVLVVEPGEMPTDQPIAAILRW